MEERKIMGGIEDEVNEEERGKKRKIPKFVQSIESPRFN